MHNLRRSRIIPFYQVGPQEVEGGVRVRLRPAILTTVQIFVLIKFTEFIV
jgi:hypothetical protein